jgi:hypothetical protein
VSSPFPPSPSYPLLPYIYPNHLLSFCGPPTFVSPSLPPSSCAHSHVFPTHPVTPPLPPLHLCLLIMNPLSPCAPSNVRFPHLPPAMCHSMIYLFTVCSNSSPLQCYIRSIKYCPPCALFHVLSTMCLNAVCISSMYPRTLPPCASSHLTTTVCTSPPFRIPLSAAPQ